MYIPDYEKGILSTMNAIRAYVGLDTYQKLDDELYAWLQGHSFQQVVVMLIDGMGAYQIDRYCEENGFFKTYQRKIVDTVYPPNHSCRNNSHIERKAALCEWMVRMATILLCM